MGATKKHGPSALLTVFAQNTVPPKMCAGIISARHSSVNTPQGAQLPMGNEGTRQEL